jgi:hypothetical protein
MKNILVVAVYSKGVCQKIDFQPYMFKTQQ